MAFRPRKSDRCCLQNGRCWRRPSLSTTVREVGAAVCDGETPLGERTGGANAAGATAARPPGAPMTMLLKPPAPPESRRARPGERAGDGTERAVGVAAAEAAAEEGVAPLMADAARAAAEMGVGAILREDRPRAPPPCACHVAPGEDG